MTEEQVREIARLEAAFRSAEEDERRVRDAYREARTAGESAPWMPVMVAVTNTEHAHEAWQRAVNVRVELPS